MPKHSIPKGALRVPQRTYAIAKLGCGPEALVTKNLLSCMAFAGVDKAKGIAFLAHFDTFVTSGALPRMLADVKSITGDDLSGFELHEVASFSPWIPYLFLAVLPFTWGVSVYLFLACLIAGVLLGSTRLVFQYQLCRLRRNGFKLAKPQKHRPMGWLNVAGRAMCWVDCVGNFDASPQVHGYEPPDDSFPKLQKAEGSV